LDGFAHAGFLLAAWFQQLFFIVLREKVIICKEPAVGGALVLRIRSSGKFSGYLRQQVMQVTVWRQPARR
jgi:hypothetical protein